jgi:transcriptional regulator with XRE-family HTH domain
MLRSSFVGLFWSIFSERKKREGMNLSELAKRVGSTKAEMSRWFNGDPNWTLNTVANLANALDVELKIQAVERATGRVFTQSGLQENTTSIVQPRRMDEGAETDSDRKRPLEDFLTTGITVRAAGTRVVDPGLTSVQ